MAKANIPKCSVFYRQSHVWSKYEKNINEYIDQENIPLKTIEMFSIQWKNKQSDITFFKTANDLLTF